VAASAPATAAPQPAALLEDVCAASRDGGLAAGLTRVVASGCAVPGTPASRTLVPAGAVETVQRWRLPAGTLTAEDVVVTPLPHGLAGCADLVRVQVTARAPRAPGTAGSGGDGDLVRAAVLLGAVRIGLTERMLRLAAGYLSGREVGGQPLIRRQLLQAATADVAAGLDLCRRWLPHLATTSGAAALHTRLTDLGWSVTTMFGAGGYLRTHPVSCLCVAELVADTWVGAGPAGW